jgi:deazaflavin-dependent oxidoreductase (nitroreductase family)
MAKTYRLDAAQRAGNALFSFLTRMGWGAGYRWILSAPGRISGTMRSTPVDVMNIDGQRWLVAPYRETNWVKNVQAHPRVTLRRGGETDDLVAIPAAGSEVLPVIRQYLRQVPITAAYWGVTAESADADIERESVTHPVFRLQDSSGYGARD